MKPCEDYQALISRLLDGDLSEEEQRRVQRHIASCPDCRAMYDAFVSLSDTLREDLAEPPERLHELVMADVRREALRRRQAPPRLRRLLALAACAALVILGVSNLPRMGGAKSAAPEAAVVQDAAAPELFAAAEAEESAGEAFFADLPAEAPASADAPAANGARKTEGAPAAGAEMPAPLPDEAAAGEEAAEPAPEAAGKAALWPYLLIALPLFGAAVLLLTRRRGR